MIDEHVEIVKEVLSMGLSRAAMTFSALLEGVEANIWVEQARVGTYNDVQGELGGGATAVHYTFKGAASGKLVLFVPMAQAAKIAHMILGIEEGGEGTVGDFEKDVLLQTFQQFQVQAAQTMGEFLGTTIEPDEALVVPQNGASLDDPGQPHVILDAKLQIGDQVDSAVKVFCSKALAESLSRALTPAEAKEEAEGAPAAEKPGAGDDMAALGELLEGADQAAGAEAPAKEAKPAEAQPVRFAPFDAPPQPAAEIPANLDLVLDVPMDITVELGRAKKSIRDILEVGSGSIIELDKLEGEPVDVLANGKLFAKGEVVVIGETFGVRIVEVLAPHEQMRRLRG